ncbi:MAG: hypothetical protein Q4B57_07675 [Eubacteriales bacterium]|nr:hypothetical protein [Eubacteriales bacterium]
MSAAGEKAADDVSTYNELGQIVFSVSSSATENSRNLNILCNNDEPKTIVIPAGSTVTLRNAIVIGSNTTILADGATIVMTQSGKRIIYNRTDVASYQGTTNVTIKGGTWKTAGDYWGESLIRLAYGSHFLLDGMTVIGNYGGHDVELIAMQDVTVQNCTLTCSGRTSKNSVEEALQIDVAAPRTAPHLDAPYGEGLTCENISILNNTIQGSRGVCANFAGQDGEKYKNKFHRNITVIGNTMIGMSAEGCVLYNTINPVVKNNTIITYSKRKKLSYSTALNISIIGKAPKKLIKNATVVVENNECKGVKHGMQIVSLTKSKYKKATVLKNTFSALDKKRAYTISKAAVNSAVDKGNKSKKR